MVNDTTIHTMPEEVLSIILQMLPPPSKYVAMSVCKRWKNCFVKDDYGVEIGNPGRR